MIPENYLLEFLSDNLVIKNWKKSSEKKWKKFWKFDLNSSFYNFIFVFVFFYKNIFSIGLFYLSSNMPNFSFQFLSIYHTAQKKTTLIWKKNWKKKLWLEHSVYLHSNRLSLLLYSADY